MSSDKILKEQDPYLREIWAAGYDYVTEDNIMQELVLAREVDKFTKRVPFSVFLVEPFTIITGRTIDGSIHKWISEADGSCERFRNLIKPNC